MTRLSVRCGVWTALALTATVVGVPLAQAAETTNGQRTASRTSLLFTKPSGTLNLSPTPRPESRPPLLGNPYVSSGFIKKEMPSSANGQPYVSEGYVRIETDARGNATVPAGTPVPKTQTALVKRIQDACGRAARDVEVISESATTYRVRFTVRNFGDAEKVSRQILKVPELLPYQVVFEVQLQQ